MTIRVVIADDQGMVRSGFSVLLNAQPDIEVIAEAVNGQEAITQAAAPSGTATSAPSPIRHSDSPPVIRLMFPSVAMVGPRCGSASSR